MLGATAHHASGCALWFGWDSKTLQVKLTSSCHVIARDMAQTAAPGEIRTPDPQIRSLPARPHYEL